MLNAPPPVGPHYESVHDPRLSMEFPLAGLTIHYCPRNHCGAMFIAGTGRWVISTPCSPVEFLKLLESRGDQLPLEAVETFLASIHRVAAELSGGLEH